MHTCFYRHLLRSKIKMTPQKVLNFNKMSTVFLYRERNLVLMKDGRLID